MATASDCAVCNKGPERVHRQLEEAGDIHHRFSHHGEVIPSNAQAEKAQSAQRQLGPADTVLRALLADMGLFTMDDLARKELELRDGRSRTRP